jgi:hypothetical protein
VSAVGCHSTRTGARARQGRPRTADPPHRPLASQAGRGGPPSAGSRFARKAAKPRGIENPKPYRLPRSSPPNDAEMVELFRPSAVQAVAGDQAGGRVPVAPPRQANRGPPGPAEGNRAQTRRLAGPGGAGQVRATVPASTCPLRLASCCSARRRSAATRGTPELTAAPWRRWPSLARFPVWRSAMRAGRSCALTTSARPGRGAAHRRWRNRAAGTFESCLLRRQTARRGSPFGVAPGVAPTGNMYQAPEHEGAY